MQATASRPKVARLCSINDETCTVGAKIEARGLCSKHYQRWQRHGDPLWCPEPRVCSINQDCTIGGKLTRGLCDKHYWRFRKHGDPLREQPLDVCSLCGGPLLTSSKYGVCSRNAVCSAEKARVQARAFRKENPGRAYRNSKKSLDNNPLRARLAVALNSARGRARKSGLPFSLKKEDLPPIPEVCPVLGTTLKVWGGDGRDDSPSLDRIVPSRGYVAGNVRWISTRANILRRDASARELELVAQDAMQLEMSLDGASAR